jgi:translation initiation factor 5B
MRIRQPIVSVLGHVDHGKTTLLDYIRGGTGVADREAGRITQHIGATEVPLETICTICQPIMGSKTLEIPGLLFIDTPGHHAFTTLRARGGALADLAVLIVDVNEGFKPQTIESLTILKQYKTPFLVAANKIDRINGWESQQDKSFLETFYIQTEEVQRVLDNMLYKLIGEFTDHNFQSDRYDRVKDFTKTIAIIPICARSGEGVSDLLMILGGLAQRFLEDQLETEEHGAAEGTVLEVKEERGLGITIDTIIYNGSIKNTDTLIVGTSTGQPIVTKVKALLKPKPLDEIRDPRERFESVKKIDAAAGVKISAQDLSGVIAGAPVRVAPDEVTMAKIIEEIKAESQLSIETDEDGLIIKADAIGSLEALVKELKDIEVPIKRVGIGDISRRDVIDASTISDPLRKVLMAFNVKLLPEAKEELESINLECSATSTQGESRIELFNENIIYKLIEDYKKWYEETKHALEELKRGEIVHPGMFKVLPEYIFRVSKPAVVGVRVLAGRLRPGQDILKDDGRVIGKIQSIQRENQTLKQAITGDEVAISVPGATVGRQFKGEDILFVNIPESHARELSCMDLNVDEQEVLDKVIEIKRKDKFGWGM